MDSLLQRVGLVSRPPAMPPTIEEPGEPLAAELADEAADAAILELGRRWRQERALRLAQIEEIQAAERRARSTTRYWELAPWDEAPGAELFRVALGRIRRQYAYVVELTLDRAGVDSPETRHVTVSSSRLLTKREIIENAIRFANEYGAQWSQARILYGLRAGEAGLR